MPLNPGEREDSIVLELVRQRVNTESVVAATRRILTNPTAIGIVSPSRDRWARVWIVYETRHLRSQPGNECYGDFTPTTRGFQIRSRKRVLEGDLRAERDVQFSPLQLHTRRPSLRGCSTRSDDCSAKNDRERTRALKQHPRKSHVDGPMLSYPPKVSNSHHRAKDEAQCHRGNHLSSLGRKRDDTPDRN
jgi:hypothetical protein